MRWGTPPDPPLSHDLGVLVWAAFVLTPGDVSLLWGKGRRELHPPEADVTSTAGLAQLPAPLRPQDLSHGKGTNRGPQPVSASSPAPLGMGMVAWCQQLFAGRRHLATWITRRLPLSVLRSGRRVCSPGLRQPNPSGLVRSRPTSPLLSQLPFQEGHFCSKTELWQES